MPQPLDPTGTFGETPRKDSLADGPDPTHPDHAAPRPLELLEEIARGGMGAILRGATPKSAGTWRSKCC